MLRIVFLKSILRVALLLGLTSSSFSQILDDSTVLVYGPSTLNVILEENLKSNDKTLVFIDTLVGVSSCSIISDLQLGCKGSPTKASRS